MAELELVGAVLTGTLPNTSTSTYGINQISVAPATSTTANTGIVARAGTTAASFTCVTLKGIEVLAPSIGATSAATNVYGLNIAAQTGGATASYGVAIEAATTQTLWVGSAADGTTAAAGIAFGSSLDTNLYRSAADTLKTDDIFQAATMAGTYTGLLGSDPKYFVGKPLGVTSSANHGGVYILLEPMNSTYGATDGVIYGQRSGGAYGQAVSIKVFTFRDSTTNHNVFIQATSQPAFNVQTYSVTFSGVEYFAVYIPTGTGDRNPSYYSFTGWHTAIGTANTLLAIDADNVNITAAAPYSSPAFVPRFDLSATTEFTFGNDTNLYRSAANELKTDDSLYVASNLGLGVTPTAKLHFAETTTATGGISFGSDTNLYRSAANVLKTDDGFHGIAFRAYCGTSSWDAYETFVGAEAVHRFNIKADGKLEWGAGASAVDTNLYRSAADVLETDDDFVARRFGANSVNSLVLYNGSGTHPGTGAFTYGFYSSFDAPATSTTLTCGGYFGACTAAAAFTCGAAYGLLIGTPTIGAGSAITSVYGIYVDRQIGGASSSYGVAIEAATTYTLWLSNLSDPTTAAGGITFGSSGDTNLYRGGANVLKTDDLLYSERAAGDSSFGCGVAGDTNGRVAITAGGIVSFGPGNAGSDTNLYRSAANTLKTDDYLHVALSVGIGEAPLTDRLLHAAGYVNSGTSTYGVVINPEGGANNTVSVQGIYVRAQTDNVAFTCATAYGIHVLPTTAGAGSTITSNYGLYVEAQTAGGSDYGVAIDAADTQTLWVGSAADSTAATAGIAFGSSRDTNLYRHGANVLRTDDSFMVSATLSLKGSSPDASKIINATSTAAGTDTTIYGLYMAVTAPSTATGAVVGASLKAATAAAAFTCGTAFGLSVQAPTVGAGSTLSAAYGVYVNAQAGATANYGLAVEAASTQTLWVSAGSDSTTAAGGVAFGSSRDTVLYRSAANTLKTDDSLVVVGDLTLSASDIITDGTTGMKIGTATSQKLALWAKTPDVQPTNAITGAAVVTNSGTAVNEATTFGGYTLAQIAAALIRIGALA